MIILDLQSQRSLNVKMELAEAVGLSLWADWNAGTVIQNILIEDKWVTASYLKTRYADGEDAAPWTRRFEATPAQLADVRKVISKFGL